MHQKGVGRRHRKVLSSCHASLMCVCSWSRQIGKGDGDKPASIATEHLVRFHATAGTASLVLPPLFVVWEHWTRYVQAG
jgi:hypothetical protein